MRVNTTDLQNAFGRYLALAEKEGIIVVKNGRTVAKLMRYTEPEFFIMHEEAREYKTSRRISFDEYMTLVDTSDQRYELIDGEVYLLASPSFKHQVAVNEIAWHFSNYFRGKDCRPLTAPLDIKLFGLATKFEEDPNVVQPDVVVICDQEKVNAAGRYQGVPTLIVEVLSPSTRGKDMAAKLHLYMRSGVREYWVLDMEQKQMLQYVFTLERDIDCFNLFGCTDVIPSTIFTGLAITAITAVGLFDYAESHRQSSRGWR